MTLQVLTPGKSFRGVRPTQDPETEELAVVKKAWGRVVEHYFFPVVTQNGDIAHKFDQLLTQWREDTALISSSSRVVLHPSYQKIIGLGTPAVPLILQTLMEEPISLFHALIAISGTNPVPREHRGDVVAMTQDWIKWGRENNYI